MHADRPPATAHELRSTLTEDGRDANQDDRTDLVVAG